MQNDCFSNIVVCDLHKKTLHSWPLLHLFVVSHFYAKPICFKKFFVIVFINKTGSSDKIGQKEYTTNQIRLLTT